ncbi:hypothetical protein L596_026330 [Steinernema carpocapsae]|uniref:Uncharacterized protein n=1 Tax=Steinernema carpocapsae TaxID=34508 RepID=A0A4U5M112_STECR|nr:hypothetical protein L596_026330 [Steinernema carpocapsae]
MRSDPIRIRSEKSDPKSGKSDPIRHLWIIFILLLTPAADLTEDIENISIVYDFSFPYSQLILSIGSCIIYVTSPTTFIVYILLVAYLIRQAKQLHSFNVNFKQKWIFAQALIKHISEIVLVTAYAFVANEEICKIEYRLAVAVGFYVHRLFRKLRG